MTGSLRQSSFLAGKLRQKHVWKRILLERITEPVHLNVASVFVWLFGSFRAKVAFDLVLRHHHAYGILHAADNARQLGFDRITLLEFGVAHGTGLLNMAAVAHEVTQATGVRCDIYGFDTGKGMPAPRSFRDHPELFQAGDFVMDVNSLEELLPPTVQLVLGDVAETVPQFLQELDVRSPIGFVSLDLDYYYSTKDALLIFDAAPECYLPTTILYLDDIEGDSYNSYCGELLAVAEFNQEHDFRKIEVDPFLGKSRIFHRARWVGHMRTLHVLDHPSRNVLTAQREPQRLLNPYLELKTRRSRLSDRSPGRGSAASPPRRAPADRR